MIKILMLGWEYPPYMKGGLGTHCYNLLNELKKHKNLKIYFLNPHPIHKKDENLEVIGLDITQKYKEDGKILSYGNYLNEKEEEYNIKAAAVASKLNFDLIHCQDRMPIDAAIKIKKESNKPLIVTIHSTEFDKSKKPRKKRMNKEIRGMIAADKIIAISDYTKGVMINKLKINKKKMVVIGNGVDHGKIVSKNDAKIKYILSLGRLTYQKGITYLIEAMVKVSKEDDNARLLIAGEGDNDKYSRKLRSIVKKNKLDKYVSFLGFVPNRATYYKKAYIFVMPSYSEPFGITPLEALSYGTPSIISKQSGIAKYYKNCLKVDYWDTDKLAKKIVFLLKNRKEYEKLRDKAITELKNFTWKKVAEKTISLYKNMI